MSAMAKQQRAPAEWLRAASEAKGWNQTQLSEELRVSSAVVSRWVRGERVPNWSSALKIERLLGIPAKVWLEAAEARKAG